LVLLVTFGFWRHQVELDRSVVVVRMKRETLESAEYDPGSGTGKHDLEYYDPSDPAQSDPDPSQAYQLPLNDEPVPYEEPNLILSYNPVLPDKKASKFPKSGGNRAEEKNEIPIFPNGNQEVFDFVPKEAGDDRTDNELIDEHYNYETDPEFGTTTVPAMDKGVSETSNTPAPRAPTSGGVCECSCPPCGSQEEYDLSRSSSGTGSMPNIDDSTSSTGLDPETDTVFGSGDSDPSQVPIYPLDNEEVSEEALGSFGSGSGEFESDGDALIKAGWMSNENLEGSSGSGSGDDIPGSGDQASSLISETREEHSSNSTTFCLCSSAPNITAFNLAQTYVLLLNGSDMEGERGNRKNHKIPRPLPSTVYVTINVQSSCRFPVYSGLHAGFVNAFILET